MLVANPYAQVIWIIPLALVLGVFLRFPKYNVGRRPGLIAQWSAMSGRQRIATIAILVAFAVAIVAARNVTRGGREAILRQQFHIPDHLALDHFDSPTKMRINPRIAGIVRFNDSDYEAYASSLGNAALWSPVSFIYGGRGDITPSARGTGFMWYPLPYPGSAGEITMSWGANGMGEAQYVKNGHYFCTAIVADTVPLGNAPRRTTAKACRNVTRNDKNIVATMVGVLDHDTKSLYATIH